MKNDVLVTKQLPIQPLPFSNRNEEPKPGCLVSAVLEEEIQSTMAPSGDEKKEAAVAARGGGGGVMFFFEWSSTRRSLLQFLAVLPLLAVTVIIFELLHNHEKPITSRTLQIPTTASNIFALSTQFTHCTTTAPDSSSSSSRNGTITTPVVGSAYDIVSSRRLEPALDLSAVLLPPSRGQQETKSKKKKKQKKKKKKQQKSEDVVVTPTDILKQHPIVKTWISGYPGSGFRILSALVESMSGHSVDVGHGDDGSCTSNDVVSCESQYPLLPYGNWNDEPKDVIFNNRYILLLRNPAQAIVSRFNERWHSDNPFADFQAPLTDWRDYRDSIFEAEIWNWLNIIKVWDSSPYTVALHIPYEELIRPATGPTLLYEVAKEFVTVHRLAHELDDEDDDEDDEDISDVMIDKGRIPCIWKSEVLDRRETTNNDPTWTYEPGYTYAQKGRFMAILDDAIEWANEKYIEQLLDQMNRKTSLFKSKKSDEATVAERKTDYNRFVSILEGYRNDIYYDLVIDDEEEDEDYFYGE